MMKRQIRIVWNIFVAGLLVIVTIWVVNSCLPEKRPYLNPELALYANGLVAEDGTLQLYVEKSDQRQNEEKQFKSKNQVIGNRRNKQRKKQPTKEDIESYRKSLQNRKGLKKNRKNRIEMSSLDNDAIDQFIRNGEREEDLRRIHPKIRKAFLRKVIQRKGNLT